MIYLKVVQSNIPRRPENVTFEVGEDFLKAQLLEQGYVLIKQSEENNPMPPSKKDILLKEIKTWDLGTIPKTEEYANGWNDCRKSFGYKP